MEGVVNLSDRTAISSSLEAVGSCFEQDMVCSYVTHVVFFFQIMKAHCPIEITKNAESCRCLIMTRKNTIETVSRQQACVHSQKSDLQSSLQKAIAVRSNGVDPFDCQSSKKVPELKVESFLKPQNSTLVNDSHLVGVMISKTIGFFGVHTIFSYQPIYGRISK